ncbi:hypothetical protein ACWG8W_10500 [Citricoccus zhacaiensis]
MPKKFTPEFRDRAVRMVLDRQAAEGGPRAASIRVVAQSLGCGPRDPAELVLPGGVFRPRRGGRAQ